MVDLKIDPEFEALIRQLTTVEIDALTDDCIKNGIRDALIVWNGILIDGHHRYQIAKMHNLPFRTIEMQFPSRDAVKIFMVWNQIERRNLDTIEKLELGQIIKPSVEAEMKRKQLSTLKQNRSIINDATDKHTFVSKLPAERSEKSLLHDELNPDQPANAWGVNVIMGDTDKALERVTTQVVLARMADTSVGMVGMYDRVKANDEDAIKRIKSGKTTITGEYKKILNASLAEEEKARVHALSEKLKDVDLGIVIEEGLYSTSRLHSRVVVNIHDKGMNNIARNIVSDSNMLVIISRMTDIFDAKETVSLSMKFRGASVMDTDKGILMALVFGDAPVELPGIVGGDFVVALTGVLQAITRKGDVAINPYPIDGKIALACKAAELETHVFTGGKDNVTAAVRADFA